MFNWRHFYSVSGLVFIGVVLLLVNLLSSIFLQNIKFDLTADRLYTLSQGTQNIIADLQQPLTIKLYFSEKLLSASPSIATYGKRVKELLTEYASLSDGKIILEIKNPQPYSDEEAEAMYYHLQGIPVDAAGSLAYFGLAGINNSGKWKAIPYFQPEQEEALEYEISKLIYSLSHPKRPLIGLMSKLPLNGQAANAYVGKTREWFILSQLKRSFDVQHLKTDLQIIPENIDVLMLVHPRQLNQKTLYAIDQFVLAGGRTIVFADAFSEADVSVDKLNATVENYSTPLRDSIPLPLFNAWGLELVKGFVAADRQSATRIKSRIGGLEKGEVDYVAWLTLSNKNFNAADVISRNIQSIVMASSGVLRKIDSAETRFTPLIKTSDQSMAIDAASIQFFTSPEELLQMYLPGGQPFVLAARISGNIKSAFPNGIKDTNKKNHLSESTEPVNLIVVADTDMLRDMFWVDFQDFYGRRTAMPRADNDTFVINAIDNLSGSNDLINLRSRGKSLRPFTRVAAMRAAADQEYRIKERILQEKLSEVGYKIKQLQQNISTKNGQLKVSPQQLEEINKFRIEHIKIRKDLRNVQHALSLDIENLGTKLKIINIALIPAVIIFLALILGVMRVRNAASN